MENPKNYIVYPEGNSEELLKRTLSKVYGNIDLKKMFLDPRMSPRMRHYALDEGRGSQWAVHNELCLMIAAFVRPITESCNSYEEWREIEKIGQAAEAIILDSAKNYEHLRNAWDWLIDDCMLLKEMNESVNIDDYIEGLMREILNVKKADTETILRYCEEVADASFPADNLINRTLKSNTEKIRQKISKNWGEAFDVH